MLKIRPLGQTKEFKLLGQTVCTEKSGMFSSDCRSEEVGQICYSRCVLDLTTTTSGYGGVEITWGGEHLKVINSIPVLFQVISCGPSVPLVVL